MFDIPGHYLHHYNYDMKYLVFVKGRSANVNTPRLHFLRAIRLLLERARLPEYYRKMFELSKIKKEVL